MKRLLTGIAASALVLSLCVTGALAAGHGYGGGRHHSGSWSQGTAWTGACGGYVGGGGGGVCDNHGTGLWYTDADGDGVCDYYGTGRGGGCGRYCR